MKREFEWDENKNNKNKIKHKISFENAKDVFEDENRLQYALDVNGEKRYLTIKLKVDDEIAAGLAATNIDLDSLVSELITGFYRSSKAIKA